MPSVYNRSYKIRSDKTGCCLCGMEFSGKFVERDARKHAIATGHSPTIFEQFDIHRKNPND